jgi:hypothetical protein
VEVSRIIEGSGLQVTPQSVLRSSLTRITVARSWPSCCFFFNRIVFFVAYGNLSGSQHAYPAPFNDAGCISIGICHKSAVLAFERRLFQAIVRVSVRAPRTLLRCMTWWNSYNKLAHSSRFISGRELVITLICITPHVLPQTS